MIAPVSQSHGMASSLPAKSWGCTSAASQETGANAPDSMERDGRRQPVLVYQGSHLLEVRVLLPESTCSRTMGIILAYNEAFPDSSYKLMHRLLDSFLLLLRYTASYNIAA